MTKEKCNVVKHHFERIFIPYIGSTALKICYTITRQHKKVKIIHTSGHREYTKQEKKKKIPNDRVNQCVIMSCKRNCEYKNDETIIIFLCQRRQDP